MKQEPTKTNTVPATSDEGPTPAQKFLAKLTRQMDAATGASITWTPLQQTYAQHLFVVLDSALADAEARRSANPKRQNDPPVVWQNVDWVKLAPDATNIVQWGLDAFTRGHVYVIPYKTKSGKYRLDIRVGYVGEDLLARTFSIDNVVSIRYHLVYNGDRFAIGHPGGVETPVFEPASYFAPDGDPIGGFGHIVCEDPRRNRVVVVTGRDFDKAKKGSEGTAFWGGMQQEWRNGKLVDTGHDDKFFVEMCYKTVVRRVTKTIQKDPLRISAEALDNALYGDIDAIEAEYRETVDSEANKGEAISLPEPPAATPVDADPETGEVAQHSIDGNGGNPGF